MDLSQTDAESLLNKAKYIIEAGEFIKTYTIDIEKDFDVKLNLSSEDKEAHFFFGFIEASKIH